MGKSKINPLKYFNDQKDSRTKAMSKSLKRFQDENSVVTSPQPPSSQNANVEYDYTNKKGTRYNLGMDVPVSTDPNSRVISSSPVIKGGIKTDSGFGVSGQYNPGTGEYTGGLSYEKSGNWGNLKVNLGASGGGGRGNATPNRNITNQGVQTSKPQERKGGSIKKKKK